VYLLKQWIYALTSPLAMALLLAVAGAISRQLGRRRTGFSLLIAAAAVAYLGGLPAIGDCLLRPLEHEYQPLGPGTIPAVGFVVVLGSTYLPRDSIPVTAALDSDGLIRVVEGVRLARQLSDVKLVLSGGAPPGAATSAHGYAELARGLGMPDASIVVLDSALNTRQEARVIAARLGSAPFLLVTSAFHMPRAVREFRRAGARPIPAPTGQLTDAPGAAFRRWLPDASGLAKTERALHEYLGLAMLAVRSG
jgi:uncharacterized SAM-binding protein YcdF (DUF218 family)